ncbi:hypothetical protein F2Q69_00036828 [Brassica cretica]|uniref:Uncharacterized protein n=1 Tax=Brassica cretica TaxID=69181 RepID=A0A8S9SD57_BRACR|nr:hypothetical protein F2Q69_00036828 [Brassica cretica]
MLAVQVTVFHIWKQRDNYLHNDISLPLSTIVKLIDREIWGYLVVSVELEGGSPLAGSISGSYSEISIRRIFFFLGGVSSSLGAWVRGSKVSHPSLCSAGDIWWWRVKCTGEWICLSAVFGGGASSVALRIAVSFSCETLVRFGLSWKCSGFVVKDKLHWCFRLSCLLVGASPEGVRSSYMAVLYEHSVKWV